MGTTATKEWGLRADAWKLVAASFRFPDEGLAQLVASGAWLDAAFDLVRSLDLHPQEGFGLGLYTSVDVEAASYGMVCDIATGICSCVDPAPDAEAVLAALEAEAKRLFVGDPRPLCEPREGAWRGDECATSVKAFARACDFVPEACGQGETADHVSVECSLLAELARRADVESSAQEEQAAADYRRFFEEHAACWMPAFARFVAEQSREAFYRSSAQLLEALLAV